MRTDLFTRLAVIAVIAAFVAAPFTVEAGGDIPPIEVRIATLNVKEGIGGPGSFAREAMGDFLTVIDENPGNPATGLLPDVVCLQEARSISDINAFRDDFLPGYTVNRVFDADFGGNFNAILSAPGIAVLNIDVFGTGGPRPVLRAHLQPEGALGVLSVYSAHFKAFGDQSSQATRTIEANSSGVRFNDEFLNGADVDDDGIPDFSPELTTIAFAGDLNSNNNFDGTIDGIFTNFQTGQPTGGLNLPYESLAGAGAGGPPIIQTFASGSRLDYIVLDERTAMGFDADGSGDLSQDEINSIGFVYFSGDDGGAMSNGNSGATGSASDHRPVVVNLLLEPDPDAFFAATDINQDEVTNSEDLAVWEALFADGMAPDVNDDSQIDASDRAEIRDTLRESEAADVTATR